MDVFKAISGRRSVRRFTKKNIEPEKLKKIISAANFAPSACNIQGWKFIIINKQKIKEKLVDAGTIEFIKYAPIGILVLYDNRSENSSYNDYVQSASASIQNMLLAAHSMGIGSCWICHLPPKQKLRKILKIHSSYDPIAYIPLGYPKITPKPLKRKYNFNELVSINQFKFKNKTPRKVIAKRFIKKIAFRIYGIIPFKKYLLPITKKFEKFN